MGTFWHGVTKSNSCCYCALLRLGSPFQKDLMPSSVLVLRTMSPSAEGKPVAAASCHTQHQVTQSVSVPAENQTPAVSVQGWFCGLLWWSQLKRFHRSILSSRSPSAAMACPARGHAEGHADARGTGLTRGLAVGLLRGRGGTARCQCRSSSTVQSTATHADPGTEPKMQLPVSACFNSYVNKTEPQPQDRKHQFS